MKIFITGLANSGKTTIFNALTGLNLQTTPYPTIISKGLVPHHGVVNVPDKRLDDLSSIFKPKKTTYATLEYIDYLGIMSGDTSHNKTVFEIMKDADAILHVVRCFEDESVIHPSGGINPLRDVISFETEMILGDLEFVEKRLERINEQLKRGKRPDETDKGFLLKCKEALEDELSLRDIEFTDAEKRLMPQYQFLTTIPEIIVLNIDEDAINSEMVRGLEEDIKGYFNKNRKGLIPPVLTICGRIEMEIAQLPEGDRRDFLKEMGIDEPALNRLIRVSYNLLRYISFFTVGKDEVKAWTIKKDTNALTASGKIHSDIERGFIKAEVVGYDDFVSCDKDMHKVREKGLLRLEGKDYIVQDGDIITFKFNV